jgi:hypothetical protein
MSFWPARWGVSRISDRTYSRRGDRGVPKASCLSIQACAVAASAAALAQDPWEVARLMFVAR